GPGTVSVTLTEPRTILGSPEYMSPEQLRDSASVDARSDIWACGVILYELLTGHVPFAGPTLADLCAQIVSGEPKELAAWPDVRVPSPVARVIDRCLRKTPSDRPQDVAELASALAPFASEASRSLLSRIRAWCGSSEAATEGPRSRLT